MAEWTRPPVDPTPSVDYAARIQNLKNGGGLNGSTVLNTSVVSNDGTTIDRIFGNEDLDWLWKSSTDVLGDAAGDETVQAL